VKLNWNFQKGRMVGVLEKYPFHREGMVIFWNYTYKETQK